MEQDDIRLIWKELNEKINASEIASKKTLSYILESKRKTVHQRMVSADLVASVFCLLFTFMLAYLLFRENHGYLLLKIEAIVISLTVSAFNYFSFRKLSKLKMDGSFITLYKQVTSYKRLLIWAYFIPYLQAIIFGISLQLLFPQTYLVKTLLSLIFPICIAIDFFIYRWSSSQIRNLIDMTKELKELNQWKE